MKANVVDYYKSIRIGGVFFFVFYIVCFYILVLLEPRLIVRICLIIITFPFYYFQTIKGTKSEAVFPSMSPLLHTCSLFSPRLYVIDLASTVEQLVTLLHLEWGVAVNNAYPVAAQQVLEEH
jgi:hypothetical protein